MRSSAACNIGQAEAQYRRRIGYAGLIFCIAYAGLVLGLDLPRIFRWGLMLPAGMALAGFLQAGARFCVAYGMKGITSLDAFRRYAPDSDPSGARHRSIRMLVLIGLGSIAAAFVFYLLG